MPFRQHSIYRAGAVAALACALATGCQMPQKKPDDATAAPVSTTQPAVSATAAPTPVSPGAIEPPLDPSDKHAIQERVRAAVLALERGEEDLARSDLQRVLASEPTNELARKMMDQIQGDAQKEFGPAHFKYQVQPGDRLSDLAQRCLGDKFKFYMLAKYNDLRDSRKIAAGQTVKIPGAQRNCARAPEAAKPATAASAPGAVAAPTASPSAAVSTPAAPPAAATPASAPAAPARAEAIRRYDREANAAFQRQDLDRAIALWDRLLELDPDNERAKLNRARALDLQQRIKSIPAKN